MINSIIKTIKFFCLLKVYIWDFLHKHLQFTRQQGKKGTNHFHPLHRPLDINGRGITSAHRGKRSNGELLVSEGQSLI